MPRIPEVGDDGLYRFNCPSCGKLIFRYDRSLRGGPIQEPCGNSACRDSSGRRTMITVSFNTEGPQI